MKIYCSICKDLFSHHSEVMALECGHLYHNACFLKRFVSDKTCVKCRCPITKGKTRKIHFDMEHDEDEEHSSLETTINELSGNFKTLSEKINNVEKNNLLSRGRTHTREKAMQTSREDERNEKEAMRSALEKVQQLIKRTLQGTSTMILKTETAPIAINQLCTVVEALIQQNKSKELELEELKKEKYAGGKQIEALILSNTLLEEQLKHFKTLKGKRSNEESMTDKSLPSYKKIKTENLSINLSTSSDESDSYSENSSDNSIKLRFRLFPDLDEIHFKVKMTMQMGKLKKSYSERTGISVTSLRFIFNGKSISDNETPKQLKMKNDYDLIDVFQAPDDPEF